MNPTWQCSHKGAKINIFRKDKFMEYISQLPEKIEIVVRAKTNSRSANQNKYYWGVVIELIAQHTGHTKDEIHEILKARSDVCRDCLVLNNKTYGIIKSTTSLDTKQMEIFLAECRQWASQELGVFVPLPNEVDY